jgi:toxin ParE1/3/4
MIRVIHRSDCFWADIQEQVDWYRENAGPEVGVGYVNAVEATLQALAKTPGLGRPRFQNRPELSGVRSWRVERPFHRYLIFYRFDEENLMAERVIHGACDLPRRLIR